MSARTASLDMNKVYYHTKTHTLLGALCNCFSFVDKSSSGFHSGAGSALVSGNRGK